MNQIIIPVRSRLLENGVGPTWRYQSINQLSDRWLAGWLVGWDSPAYINHLILIPSGVHCVLLPLPLTHVDPNRLTEWLTNWRLGGWTDNVAQVGTCSRMCGAYRALRKDQSVIAIWKRFRRGGTTVEPREQSRVQHGSSKSNILICRVQSG